jgi:type II secretory pathway pseudopilin PulG
LLELLIVMGIVSILSVLLFRTYNTISEIAFRIQQEKNVMDEVLSFSQMLQNFTDRNTLDYDYYSASGLVENR